MIGPRQEAGAEGAAVVEEEAAEEVVVTTIYKIKTNIEATTKEVVVVEKINTTATNKK